MTSTAASWSAANQRYLVASLGVLRARLQQHIARARGRPQNDSDLGIALHALQAARGAMPAPAALERISHVFRLSQFEQSLLLLCAAIELDAAFSALCAEAHGDAERGYATFGLALAALEQPHWSAITPAAPLRHWRL